MDWYINNKYPSFTLLFFIFPIFIYVFLFFPFFFKLELIVYCLNIIVSFIMILNLQTNQFLTCKNLIMKSYIYK